VLDLDNAPLPAKWEVVPHVIIETSPDRHQCFFALEPTTNFAAVENINRGLAAHYGGDTTHAPSSSSPVAFTVMSEASMLQPQLVTSDFATGDVSFDRTSTHYGSPYILRVDVANAAGLLCADLMAPIPYAPLDGPCAAGTVTLTSDGQPLDAGTFTLNDRGYVEDAFIQLDAGEHSIVASYGGDGGFMPSTRATPSC
jgi:hypothetical protein